MANPKQIENLKEICKSVLDFKKKELVTRPQWGSANFESIEGYLDTTFLFAETLLASKILAVIPHEEVSNIVSLFDQLTGQFSQMNAFDVSVADAHNKRLAIIHNVESLNGHLAAALSPWMPVLILKSEDREAFHSEMNEILEKARVDVDEIEGALGRARVAPAAFATGKFSEGFEEEAKEAERRLRRWIWPSATLSFLALIIAIGVAFDFFSPFSGRRYISGWEAAYNISGRLIAISILFYASVWCGKISLANMNIRSIYKHRSVSLKTLDMFAVSVKDQTARDTIVSIAAKACFEHIHSGFVRTEDARGPSSYAQVFDGMKGPSPSI